MRGSNLNPGGYIELYDPMFGIRSDDGTLPPDSALAKWDKLMLEASYTAGCYLNSPLAYKQQLIAAGFTDVTQVALVWPTNTWPKNKMLKTIGRSACFLYRHLEPLWQKGPVLLCHLFIDDK